MMKKTSRLVSLFATSLVVVPLTGCSDDGEEVEVCYDLNYDMRCDNGGERVQSDDYLVIDGKKTRIFIKDDKFYQGYLGDYDGGGSYGG